MEACLCKYEQVIVYRCSAETGVLIYKHVTFLYWAYMSLIGKCFWDIAFKVHTPDFMHLSSQIANELNYLVQEHKL